MKQKDSTQNTGDLRFIQDVITSGKTISRDVEQRFYQAIQEHPYETWLLGTTINPAFYSEHCSQTVERHIALMEKKDMFRLLPGFTDHFDALEEISLVDQTNELGKSFFRKLSFEWTNVQQTIKGHIKITAQDVILESDAPIQGITLRAKHIRGIHVANNHRYFIYGGTVTEMAGREAAVLIKKLEAFIDALYKHTAFLFEAYYLVFKELQEDDLSLKFGQVEFDKLPSGSSEVNEVIFEETGISLGSTYLLLDNLQRIIFLNPELFSVYYWRIEQVNSVR